MVASKTSIIFAAVALGAVSTHALPTFNRVVRRATPEGPSSLAPRDVMAGAAGAFNSTPGGASGFAVAGASSTSDKAKPQSGYRNQPKNEGYPSGGQGHEVVAAAAGTSESTSGSVSGVAVAAASSTSDEAKPRHKHHEDEGYASGEEGHGGKEVEGHHHHHGHHGHHHHHGHHGHHHEHEFTEEDQEIFQIAFDQGFGAGYEAALGATKEGHHHHHGHHHHGHHHHHHGHHHHHHGHHPHGEEPAAKASVNETITVQTEAAVQPQHNWKRDLAHGLGLEDEFFMKRDLEERDFEELDLEERDFEDLDLEERDFEEDEFMY